MGPKAKERLALPAQWPVVPAEDPSTSCTQLPATALRPTGPKVCIVFYERGLA